MPLRAGQILLRAPSLDALGDLVERALRRQGLAPGAVRELLALQGEEWACVLEQERTDGGLARLLSEAGGGPVIALELDAARFFLRVRRFAEGEPGPQRQEPQEIADQLPRVCDVEQEAWDELRALGVPPSLRLCAAEDVELLASGDDGIPALRLRASAAGVERTQVRALPPERPESTHAPARPDSVVQSKAGETRAIEVRELPDLPLTPEAAEALAAVEEQVAYRLCLQLAPDAEGPRLPRPAFVYRYPRGELLQQALKEAREARPWLARLLDPAIPAPLSHEGFSDRARALLGAALPEARVLRAHGLWLELLHPGAEGRAVKVGLESSWRAVLRGEEAEPDPAAAGDGGPIVGQARTLLQLPLLPVSSWPADAVLRGLLPTLVPEAASAGRATLPFAGPLHVALLCDDGDQLAPVDEAALEAAGLGFAEALARAVENADALTLRAPQGLLWFDVEHGRVAMTDFDDPAGAGRLVSRFFRSLLLDLLGGFCFAAAPTRDTLLACAPADPAAVAWLRGEATRRFREGPFPLDPTLFDVTEEEVSEVSEDPFGLLS